MVNICWWICFPSAKCHPVHRVIDLLIFQFGWASWRKLAENRTEDVYWWLRSAFQMSISAFTIMFYLDCAADVLCAALPFWIFSCDCCIYLMFNCGLSVVVLGKKKLTVNNSARAGAEYFCEHISKTLFPSVQFAFLFFCLMSAFRWVFGYLTLVIWGLITTLFYFCLFKILIWANIK